MAESTIAGDYPFMGSVVPMILSEGTMTVTARVYNTRGNYDTGVTFASELRKGDPVALAYGERIKYATSGGLSMATRITNATGKQMRGRIVSEPRWIGAPPSSAGTYPNLSTNITNKRVRIADVELWGVQKVHACKLTTANLGEIIIGKATGVAVSAASSYSSHKVCVEDDASTAGEISFINLTYHGKDTAGTAYTVLIGSPTGIKGRVHT